MSLCTYTQQIDERASVLAERGNGLENFIPSHFHPHALALFTMPSPIRRRFRQRRSVCLSLVTPTPETQSSTLSVAAGPRVWPHYFVTSQRQKCCAWPRLWGSHPPGARGRLSSTN